MPYHLLIIAALLVAGCQSVIAPPVVTPLPPVAVRDTTWAGGTLTIPYDPCMMVGGPPSYPIAVFDVPLRLAPVQRVPPDSVGYISCPSGQWVAVDPDKVRLKWVLLSDGAMVWEWTDGKRTWHVATGRW